MHRRFGRKITVMIRAIFFFCAKEDRSISAVCVLAACVRHVVAQVLKLEPFCLPPTITSRLTNRESSRVFAVCVYREARFVSRLI